MLPEPLDTVSIENNVSTHQHNFVCLGLCQKQPIERVAMMAGK